MMNTCIRDKYKLLQGGNRMKLLVTGATGKLGSKVVETLLKTVPAEQVVISVRNPEKAEGL